MSIISIHFQLGNGGTLRGHCTVEYEAKVSGGGKVLATDVFMHDARYDSVLQLIEMKFMTGRSVLLCTVENPVVDWVRKIEDDKHRLSDDNGFVTEAL